MLSNFLSLIFLVVCFLAPIENLAIAGDSRGGGNTFPQNLASKGEIENTIYGVKTPLLMFLRSEKWLAGPGYHRQGPTDLVGRTFDKLFNNPVNSPVKHTILDEISIFDFDIRQTGPCQDLDGKEVDASAFNTNPKKICFSLERLSQKLSKGEVEVQILALAAHEASHRVGTTEEEAEMLQSLAIERLTIWHTNLIMQREALHKQYEDVVDTSNSILKGIASGVRDANICYLLSDLRSEATAANTVVYTAFNNNVISFVPFDIKPEVDSLGLKSFSVAGFCFQDPSGNTKILAREVTEIRALAKKILNSFY